MGREEREWVSLYNGLCFSPRETEQVFAGGMETDPCFSDSEEGTGPVKTDCWDFPGDPV